jgi:hypothetical protein
MARIRSRTSSETAGLPVVPCRTFQVQNNWNPFRCQAMTVSGLTMTSADLQSAQAPDNHAQKTRSATVNFGRFLAERRSTPIWCRKATFSTWRAARERKTENTVERNRHRTLNIGLASPFRTSANLMISERLKFPRITVGFWCASACPLIAAVRYRRENRVHLCWIGRESVDPCAVGMHRIHPTLRRASRFTSLYCRAW